MGGRLSSLTRLICNAEATWCEFCPEIRRKTKKSPSVAIFSQPNSNEDQTNEKNKVFTPVCTIFIGLIEIKTKAKRFYLTILLFVIFRGGVEDTRLEAKAKAKDTKKSEAKAKDSLSEDRHSRGQGQECSRPRPRTKDTAASVFHKKRSSKIFFRHSPIYRRSQNF